MAAPAPRRGEVRAIDYLPAAAMVAGADLLEIEHAGVPMKIEASTLVGGGGLMHTLTLGAYLTGGTYDGSADVTAAVDATDANTASTVVARDASGNFAAGTITMVNAEVDGILAIGAPSGTSPATTQALQLHSTNAIGMLVRYTTVASGGALLKLARSHSATIAKVSVVDGDMLGGVNFVGIAGDNSTAPTGAQILSTVATGGVGATTVAGDIQFGTTNLAGTLATRLELTSEGVLQPASDNTYALGTSALRWSNLQAASASVSGILSVGSQPSQAGATTQVLQVNALSIGTSRWARFGNDSAAVAFGAVKSRGTAIGLLASALAGDQVFSLNPSVVLADNATLQQVAGYIIQVDPLVTVTSTIAAAQHVWTTRNAAGAFGTRLYIQSSGTFTPAADNTYDIGDAANGLRFHSVYAYTGDFSSGIVGTLSTAAQGNVTSLGTLSILAINGANPQLSLSQAGNLFGRWVGNGTDSQILYYNAGTPKWQTGINISIGSDYYELYSQPAGGFGFAINPSTLQAIFGGVLQTLASLVTADPGSGAGAWKLGKVITAAAVLDGTKYVEVDIDGTVVKLCKAV